MDNGQYQIHVVPSKIPTFPVYCQMALTHTAVNYCKQIVEKETIHFCFLIF